MTIHNASSEGPGVGRDDSQRVPSRLGASVRFGSRRARKVADKRSRGGLRRCHDRARRGIAARDRVKRRRLLHATPTRQSDCMCTEQHRPRIGDIRESWGCPVCDAPVDLIFRPGRPRLYCSQACRQKAYRWRCQHGARTRATPTQHAPQASTTARAHALRTPADPMSRLRDRRRREVTACGALVTPSRLRPVAHARFLPDSEGACLTCAGIVTSDLAPDAGPHHPAPVEPADLWMRRWRLWLADPAADWRSVA